MGILAKRLEALRRRAALAMVATDLQMMDDAMGHEMTDRSPEASLVRLADIRARLSRAEAAAGRLAGAVTLVAVSKTVPAEAIEPILAAGVGVFGENRVQEALAKWPALKARHPSTELHLIGPLQTNKAREAVRLFDVIETLDRAKLAHAIADEAARAGRCPSLFVQVNTGAEAQKAGVLPGEAAELIRLGREELRLPIIGLMAIPPADEPPEPHFRMLAGLARAHGLSLLSMGMSGDYEVAIACGATHVRIGSAIFGARA